MLLAVQHGVPPCPAGAPPTPCHPPAPPTRPAARWSAGGGPRCRVRAVWRAAAVSVVGRNHLVRWAAAILQLLAVSASCTAAMQWIRAVPRCTQVECLAASRRRLAAHSHQTKRDRQIRYLEGFATRCGRAGLDSFRVDKLWGFSSCFVSGRTAAVDKRGSAGQSDGSPSQAVCTATGCVQRHRPCLPSRAVFSATGRAPHHGPCAPPVSMWGRVKAALAEG